MRTYWEHIGNCKIKTKYPLPLAPLPTPTQKEKSVPKSTSKAPRDIKRSKLIIIEKQFANA
jgi:hypothetical protein